jgi:hypothetical protein
VKNPFGLFYEKFPVSVLVGFHVGENLQTGFHPAFHPKSKQLVLNVRTGSPSEICPTLVESWHIVPLLLKLKEYW